MAGAAVFEQQGFPGFSDIPGPGELVYWMENLRFEEPGNPGSALVARGPWSRLGTVGTPSYGTVTHTGGVYEFIKNNGTTLLVFVSGGKFYTWDGSSLTEALSAANLSGASITLSSTAVVHFATFNNQLVVSDGTNTPWMWDGTAGSGLTKLTNAPTAYGPPAVYYAKLFFIDASDRATIKWSEENQANTGYVASGYNNQWTLLQSGSEGLVALRGTNEALYYWRFTGYGAIRGAVTPDFRTTGTHDEGSEEIGLLSGAGMVEARDAVWFADQLGRPWRMRGGAPEPLWRGQLDRTFGGQGTSAPYNLSDALNYAITPGVASVECVYHPSRDAVGFAYTASSSGKTTTFYFACDSGQLIEIGTWGSSGSVGTARLGSYQRLRAGAQYTGVAAISRAGKAMVLFDLGASHSTAMADEIDAASSVAYTPLVIGQQRGNAGNVAYRFDEMSVISESGSIGGAVTSGSITCQFDYLTSVAYTSALMASAQSSTVSSGESGVLADRSHRFGLAGYGRWIVPRVRLTISYTSGTIHRLAIKGWTLTGYPEKEPRVR